jgi:hypothetical protein
MFYSKSTNGFYDKAIHGDAIPTDAIEITNEQYDSLFKGQSEGKQITADENGNPVLIDAAQVAMTYSQLRSREYPPMQDYFDGVVKGDQAQIDKYLADCLAVKAKYPKPAP